ncbi:hypothetical protein CUJ91_25215 [Paraburkholderia graminis]|nr:hypothetical protein CUJ91_25215 [Paraburkholderia graminis]
MQNTRANTVSNVQSNYHGDCNNCSNSDWDGGSAAVGFVAGAMVVGATAAATAPPPATAAVVAAPAPVAPPCNVAPIAVNEVPYYKCGATWFATGYGSGGVVYTQVPPPPGY